MQKLTNSCPSEITYRDQFSNRALFTDYYELSMALGYWRSGKADDEAVFHLFFRRPPFKGGYTIASGLEAVVHFIEQFRFSESDIAYLKTLSLFDDSFLQMLLNLKLSVSIDAVPEGTVVFPYEPLLRIQGPLLQCQLLESALLNLINFPTLIATKAARVASAAQGDEILEFGLRRAQGVDGAITASRASYIGGVSATSNTLAGKLFQIPVAGTQAHSWIMAYDEEEASFQAYAEALPDSCLFLVDTYDTLEGVKKACRVGKWLKSQGKKLLGVRLDSGDLTFLSIEARKILDEEGFPDAKIVASNELDEILISELKRQGAKITVFGVGTNLVTGKDQGALDGVYKISAIREKNGKWKYTLKLSEQLSKISTPGLQEVRRYYDKGIALADVIYDKELKLSSPCHTFDPFDPSREMTFDEKTPFKDLLVPVFRSGQRVYDLPSLRQIRDFAKQELATFSSGIKRFYNPHLFPVQMEEKLYHLKMDLIQKIRKTKKL